MAAERESAGQELTVDIEVLRRWVGRSETLVDRIDAGPARRMRATLDGLAGNPALTGAEGAGFGATGQPLPPPWHWIYFLPEPPRTMLGGDGHPRVGGLLPPVALPRRMWAGSRLRLHEDLRIGDEARKVSTVRDVQMKEGRSGKLCFVTMLHEVFVGDALKITEEQDIVYREEAAPGEKPPVPQQAPEGAAFGRGIEPDPVLLFRYSALTFNSHRIHYDRPYNENVEGYAGLVVHGPLLATLMLDSAIEQAALRGKRVAEFSFRAMSPLLDTHPFRIEGLAEGDGLKIWAAGHDGRLATLSSSVLA